MTEDGEGETVLRVPCEVYSRIVGYYRPVSAWNAGKQQEFSERVEFRPESIVTAEVVDD